MSLNTTMNKKKKTTLKLKDQTKEEAKTFNQNDNENEQSQHSLESSTLSRRKVFLEALPKFVFKLPGSYSIWKDLIGYQKYDLSINSKFQKIINGLNAAEKYSLACLIIDYGLENALDTIPIVDEEVQIENEQMPTIEPRTFVDVGIQHNS